MTNYKYNNDIFGALVVDLDKYRSLLDALEQIAGNASDTQAFVMTR